MTSNYFSQRNAAIDMFRALTMAVMLFVNDLWRVKDVPKWMEHADWAEDFMGLADFVFPCFLFAVGLSIPYAIENRFLKGRSVESTLSHILSRSIALLLMGVFLVNSEGGFAEGSFFTANNYRPICIAAFFMIWNVYPKSWDGKWFKMSLQVAGLLILTIVAFNFVSAKGTMFAAKWWGILGIIGWAYLFSAIAYLLCRQSRYGVYMVWSILFIINVFVSPFNDTWVGKPIVPLQDNFLGTFLPDTLHIDNGSHHLLVMSGVCFTVLMSRLSEKGSSIQLKAGLVIAVVMAAMSLITNVFWIFNKLSATLPWVFMAVAASAALYTIFAKFHTTRAMRGFFTIIKPAGTATLTVYMVPSLMYVLGNVLGIECPEWSKGAGIGLINCLCFSLLCIVVGGLMERCKLKLKV